MGTFDPFTPEELTALEVDDYLNQRVDITVLSDEALEALGYVFENAEDPIPAEDEVATRIRRAKNYWKWSGRGRPPT